MSNVTVYPTCTASWQSLVLEAQAASHIELTEDLQSYLVFLLMRYAENTLLNEKPIAIDFLETLHQRGKIQQTHLREVGDTCLIVSGFFPGFEETRLVQINYFVGMGQGAYSSLSHLSQKTYAQLFHELSAGFVSMMDVLQTMREMSSDTPILTPLAAAELFSETQSKHALETLDRCSSSGKFPMLMQTGKRFRH